nr:hypothetical protein BaRGS_007698 [Batillaria attramentaria]
MRETLSRLPETRLGRMAKRGMFECSKELFFDRNPKVMHGILDLYRTGELHIPKHFRFQELEFWEVPEALISECCWKTYQIGRTSKRIIDHIDHSLSDPYGLVHQDGGRLPWRTRLWLALDRPTHSFRAKIWNLTYLTFIMLSIVIFALETVDAFRGTTSRPHHSNASDLTAEERVLFSRPLPELHYLDITCNVFFTVEPLVRLVVCPNKQLFLTSALNIIDLFLIVTIWVGLVLEDFIVPGITEAAQSQGHVYLLLTMRAVLALRILRVLHLTKRFQSMKVMMLSIKASSQELGLLMTVLFMAVLIYGNLLYVAEFVAETHVFENLPLAVWWALITLTTVGYGDFYPTSVCGYFIGSACAVTGVLLLAMPIAVIATNFSHYYENLGSYDQRRKRKAFIKDVLGRESIFALNHEKVEVAELHAHHKSLHLNCFKAGGTSTQKEKSFCDTCYENSEESCLLDQRPGTLRYCETSM